MPNAMSAIWEIEADQGHDAFLLPVPRYIRAFSKYMNRIHRELSDHAS